MASTTAALATSSLTPDIEPERSRTMARFTLGRTRSVVGPGRGDAGQQEALAVGVSGG